MAPWEQERARQTDDAPYEPPRTGGSSRLGEPDRHVDEDKRQDADRHQCAVAVPAAKDACSQKKDDIVAASYPDGGPGASSRTRKAASRDARPARPNV